MELQRKELESQMTSQARKDFLRLILLQDRETDDTLDALNDELYALLGRYSSGNAIQDQDSISSGIPDLIGGFSLALLAIMQDMNPRAARIQSDQQFKRIDEKYAVLRVDSTKFNTQMIKFGQAVADYPDTVEKQLLYRNFPVGRNKLGSVLKTVEKSSIDIVRSILDVGVKEGKSARDIATDINLYIKPAEGGLKVSPFETIRKRLGTRTVNRIARREIRSGSLSSNAFMIARSEINLTWNKAVVDLNKGKKWSQGYDWVLSSSHPATDVCDTNAEGSPYSWDITLDSHPHCLCQRIARLLSLDELRNLY